MKDCLWTFNLTPDHAVMRCAACGAFQVIEPTIGPAGTAIYNLPATDELERGCELQRAFWCVHASRRKFPHEIVG